MRTAEARVTRTGIEATTTAHPYRAFNITSHVLVLVAGVAFAIVLQLPALHINTAPLRSYSIQDGKGNVDITISKYTHFQGLGFEIYTGGAPAFISPGIKNPQCVGLGVYGKVGELQCYLGLKDDKQDVKRRIQIMKAAVEKAYEVSDKSNTTLKIFNAPEFFFRGKNGAYNITREYNAADLEECHAVCMSLRGLQSLVADKRFKDWLFLFGTVISSEILPVEHEQVFVNFAPLYKGYDPAITTHLGKRLIVPKRYVSHLDFLSTKRHFNGTTAKEIFDDPLPYQSTVLSPFEIGYRQYNNDQWKKYKSALTAKGYAMVDFNFFIMDNITFSVEICLDHDKHSALDVFMANLVTGSHKSVPNGGEGNFTYDKIPSHQAQISLISSAGITVNPESLVLTNNGSIFLQDGASNDTSFSFMNPSCDVVPKLAFDGGSELVSRFAVLTQTDVYFEYRLSTPTKVVVYASETEWKHALRGSFSIHQYEPMINVYDHVVIAVTA